MTESSERAVGSSAFPIFQPISAPTLLTVGQKPLRKFAILRQQYEARIEERKAQPGGESLHAVSLKSSIDSDLLASLIQLGRFGRSVDTIEKVTDVHVKEFVEKGSNIKLSHLSREHLDRTIRQRLSMDTRELDAEQRIDKLFALYFFILRENGLPGFTKDHAEEAVGHILSVLKPPELFSRAKADLDFSRRNLKSNFLDFYDYLRTEAELCDRFVSVTSPVKNRPAPQSTVSSSPDQPESKSGTRNSNASGAAASEKTRELPQCLNTRCSGRHFIKDCPLSSEEEKKNLKKAYFDNRLSQFLHRQRWVQLPDHKYVIQTLLIMGIQIFRQVLHVAVNSRIFLKRSRAVYPVS